VSTGDEADLMRQLRLDGRVASEQLGDVADKLT
jgi:hypothetical protein